LSVRSRIAEGEWPNWVILARSANLAPVVVAKWLGPFSFTKPVRGAAMSKRPDYDHPDHGWRFGEWTITKDLTQLAQRSKLLSLILAVLYVSYKLPYSETTFWSDGKAWAWFGIVFTGVIIGAILSQLARLLWWTARTILRKPASPFGAFLRRLWLVGSALWSVLIGCATYLQRYSIWNDIVVIAFIAPIVVYLLARLVHWMCMPLLKLPLPEPAYPEFMPKGP
jgi:hypothetical protein